jgi:hypothetical protein
MKRKDILFIAGAALVLAPFFIFETILESYKYFNQHHGMIMSFLKFAVLATTGEIIGLRIKTGSYNRPGFGIAARAMVWGMLGLTIQMAFIIFSTGAPMFLEYLGVEGASQLLRHPGLSVSKILAAFTISVTMNLIYAPVMMTLHKITDTHIEQHNGRLSSLVRPIAMVDILSGINWQVQWHFVFKKTIPFFWIPAHTITFLLPPEYRVLFAAVLGIMLGVLLAMAAVKGKKS